MKTRVDTYEAFTKADTDKRHAWRRRWEVRFTDFKTEKEALAFKIRIERLIEADEVDRLTGL